MGFMGFFLIAFAVIFIACVVIEILLIRHKKYAFAIAGAAAIVIWIALLFWALLGFITSM